MCTAATPSNPRGPDLVGKRVYPHILGYTNIQQYREIENSETRGPQICGISELRTQNWSERGPARSPAASLSV